MSAQTNLVQFPGQQAAPGAQMSSNPWASVSTMPSNGAGPSAPGAPPNMGGLAIMGASAPANTAAPMAPLPAYGAQVGGPAAMKGQPSAPGEGGLTSAHPFMAMNQATAPALPQLSSITQGLTPDQQQQLMAAQGAATGAVSTVNSGLQKVPWGVWLVAGLAIGAGGLYWWNNK